MSDALAYTRTAIALHWLTVMLVGALFGLGWYIGDLPKGPWRGEMIALHKSLGITVFLLTLGRGYWRLRHPPPALPANLPRWQSRLAHGVQRLFYVLLLAQPLLGYLSSSFTPYKTRYLGLQLPVWAGPPRCCWSSPCMSPVRRPTACARATRWSGACGAGSRARSPRLHAGATPIIPA